MEPVQSESLPARSSAAVKIDLRIISTDAVMKAAYWLSRNLTCELRQLSESTAEVFLSSKKPISPEEFSKLRDDFITSATDFALRERIEAKTSSIRDLLLAKALSEAGVLEDVPQGVFGDQIEENKPDGMFKILSDSRRE